MLQTRRGEDGNLWAAGSPYTASDAFAAFLISSNLATGTLPAVEQSGISPAQGITLQAIVADYEAGTLGTGIQPATWYAGEVTSTVTPTLTADGVGTANLTPLKWRVVINADDDVDAAQRLMTGTPNVIEINPGVLDQRQNLGEDGLAETIENIYAVCVASEGAPANYTGNAYIISGAETDIADVLAAMARVEFSSGLGATYSRLLASDTYATYYSQLSVSAGVVA